MERAQFLKSLGDICIKCYQVSGMLQDLNQAVCVYNDAVQDGLTDGPDLADLGDVFMLRFERLGNLSDINSSISLFEKADKLTPDDHPDKFLRLSSLGISLCSRFEQLGDLNDINKSISLLEDAVQLTPESHPNKLLMMNYLGSSLFHRFKRLGDLNDINRSILLKEETIQLTADSHPNKPLRLNNLGNSLLARFEQLNDLRDISRAISILEDAVQLSPDRHPDKSSMLENLGNSLCLRFEQLGDLGDINRSISVLQEAVQLTPDNHPNKVSMLNHLGSSLLRRFGQLGDLSDINRSISLKEEAVRLIQDSHPNKPSRLNNLGNSLLARFKRLHDLSDINRAISVLEDAVQLTPDGHPDKCLWWNNLGNSLLHRFQQLGDLSDINRSISVLENTIRLTPKGHTNKPTMFYTLGNSLLYRFQRLDDICALARSIVMFEEAVRLTPDGHPSKPFMLEGLGHSFYICFKSLGDTDDLTQMISQYSLASQSTTGPTHVRFLAASKWAAHAQMSQHPSLLQAYTVALELLPQLAWLGSSISDRHHHIVEAGTIVCDAAAAAITACQYKQAVEWLEQGRSIIWGQLLQLRTPMDTLKDSHPDLADRLSFLSSQLEGSSTDQGSLELTDTKLQQSLQLISNQSHAYAYERDELINKIRGLEGFERFLLPRTFSQLSLAAQGGPVVVLNISASRCDALILRPGLYEVKHVPLPDFTLKDGQAFYTSLTSLTGAGRNISCHSDRLYGRFEGELSPEETLKHILSVLWQQIVHPVLDALSITVMANLQRIWWCPTGPLTFLPIHAAGLYEDNQPAGSKLSDFAISSYAPSLAALISGFQAQTTSEPPLQAFQMLTVAQPLTDGQSDLPGTLKEINHIQQNVAGKYHIQQLVGDAATVARVEKGMRECSWVHFACHGVQNVSHPTESALLLANSSQLTLSNIIRLFIPHADLAFLSACQTATGNKELQEESVHLAAGMLSAGYRSVIATMWSIMDDDAPNVADDVYAHLFKVSPPDSAQSAEALHIAVRKLREGSAGKKLFIYWVPYIHIGV
ncbi:CHAT domain-containing protein [Mycena maculata]|uniref:CHAT domain-containing protein n=1 Tax=Mycena maculata TaxID=230809 RepID=A0AAD7N334_9AGAR|nr:CHAT domain-containing protein [Mycena maculata]